MDGQNPDTRPVRVRFAPSPTGTLHVGSARTALYNYLFARHNGGVMVLRIEDTDVSRSSREYEQAVIDDLAWLGLDWDEGPDRGGPCEPYRQSERSSIYDDAAGRLLAEGKAYRCFCSQERLDKLKQECRARSEMPKYDRSCAGISPEDAAARLAAGEPATIRFRVPDKRVIVVEDIIHGPVSFATDVIGDFIIIRSDGGVSYNFAAVVDDAAMAISHVIRGEDHLTNTARQQLVCEALGHEPPAYAHHSLIMGPDGGKLSKRHGATSVGDFRTMGYLPGAIINYLALLSWSPSGDEEKLGMDEMVEQFDLAGVARSPAMFDIDKLNWLNGLYIRDLGQEQLRQAIAPFYDAAADQPPGAAGDGMAAISAAQLAVAERAIQTSLTTLADAPGQLRQFFSMTPLESGDDAVELRDPQAVAVLEMALAKLEELPATETADAAVAEAAIEGARGLLKSLKKQCKQADIPPKRLFRSLRIALSGRTSGPEVPFLLAGLGRQEVRQRLEAARRFAAAGAGSP